MKIYEHIERKIKTYDMDNGTQFFTLLEEKLNKPREAYFRGIVHGLCLALTELDVITKGDALDIVGLIYNEEE